MKFLYTILSLCVYLSIQAMEDSGREIFLDELNKFPELKLGHCTTNYCRLIEYIEYVEKQSSNMRSHLDMEEILHHGLNPYRYFDDNNSPFQFYYLESLMLLNNLSKSTILSSDYPNLQLTLPLTKIISCIKHRGYGVKQLVRALKMLLLYGSDPYLKDKEELNLSPIESAQQNCPELVDILIMGPKAFIDLEYAQLQGAAQKSGLELTVDMKQEIGEKISALHYAEPQAYKLALEKFKKTYSQICSGLLKNYLQLTTRVSNLMKQRPQLKSLAMECYPLAIEEIAWVQTHCGYEGNMFLQEMINQGLNPCIHFVSDKSAIKVNLLYFAIPFSYLSHKIQIRSLKLLLDYINPNEKMLFKERQRMGYKQYDNILMNVVSYINDMNSECSDYEKEELRKFNYPKYIQALKLLILNGADPYLKDTKLNLSAIELAQQKCPELVDTLIMGPKAFVDLRTAQIFSAVKKTQLPQLPSDMKSEIAHKFGSLHYAEPQAYELALKKSLKKNILNKKHRRVKV